MARPLTGSVRTTRSGNVELRVKGQGLTLGPEKDWPQTRIDAERERILAMFKAGVISSLAELRGREEKTGRPTVTQAPMFAEVAGRYMTNFRKSHSKPKTLTTEEGWVAHLGFFANDPVTDIDEERVQEFIDYKVRERDEIIPELRARKAAGDELTDVEAALIAHPASRGLSNQSITRAVGVLARILQNEVMDRKATRGLLDHNPAANTKALRFGDIKEPRRAVLTADQVVALIEAAEEIEQQSQARYDCLGRPAIVALLAIGGMRRSELCARKRADLNVREGLLNIPTSKTESGVRSVWLSPYVMELLKAWLVRSPFKKPSDPLFPTSLGTHRSPDNMQKDIIDKAVARANAKMLAAIEAGDLEAQEFPKDKHGEPSVRPHDFRRTYITLALANGEQPGTVIDQVGHSNERLIYKIYRQQLNQRRGRDPLLRKLYGVPAHIQVAKRELEAEAEEAA